MRVVRVGLLRPGPIDKAGHAGRGPGLGYLFRCSSPIVDGGRINRGGSGQQISRGF